MAVAAQIGGGFIATADTPTYFPAFRFGTPAIDAGAPVGNYINAYGSSRDVSLVFPATSTGSFIWMHQRFYTVNLAGYSPQWTWFSPTGIQHGCFYVDNSGYIRVGVSSVNLSYNYGTASGWTHLGTASTAVAIGQWNSLEVEITANDTTGIFKLWLNGALAINLTNVDTANAVYGGTYVQGICTLSCYIDDWVIGDASGANTGHPGELRVDCMMPNANGTDRANGGSGEMTRSTGSDDYALVDEVASSAGTGDYWYADAVGEKCSVNVAALTNTGGTIVAVQCTAYATKTDAGPCGFKIYCLRGGTRYYSDEFFPSFGSWQYYRKVWDQDPSTSAAWTESNFNAAEFGTERTT